jgi:hypothetical protein
MSQPASINKKDLTNREYTTNDTKCLYTAQGEIICISSEKKRVAPYGKEGFTNSHVCSADDDGKITCINKS